MGLQKHSKVLNDTVEMLSDEGSYHQLFHAYRDEEALPSGEVLKEIIDFMPGNPFPRLLRECTDQQADHPFSYRRERRNVAYAAFQADLCRALFC